MLEARILEAEQNVERFRNPVRGERRRTMMILRDFACVACHQNAP